MLKRVAVIICCVVLTGFTVSVSDVQAEAQKIGVMNIQKVLLESTAGQKAKGVFEKRMKELQAKFKTEQEELAALQKEIEKKSSAWSKEKQNEKVREFQTKQRELQVKSEDAKMELRQLQDKELEPILKMLQTVVNSYGEKEGYSLILDSKVAVLYSDKAVDISSEVKKELDARLK